MSLSKGKQCETCIYRLLVHHSVVKGLNEILMNSEKLKLEEICVKFESEYKRQLSYFVTNENELVLEFKSFHYDSNNETFEEKLPQGWSGLEELISKIDFSNVLHTDSKKRCERVLSIDEIKDYETVHFYCDFSYDKSKKKIQNLKVFEKSVGKSKVPDFFDKVSWKLNKVYTGFVCNIYDPSKFWMRFAEADLLQNHLWNFYNEKKEEYALSKTDICIGLNCAVFISDSFSRGRIVRTDVQDTNWFVLFLYDQGTMCRAHRQDLFKLHEKFGAFPALAVRCILSNVSPIDNESWTQEAVAKVQEFTGGNRELAVKVNHIKIKRKILEVYLADSTMKYEDKIPTINHILVHEKLAKISWHEPTLSIDDEVFKRLREFTYLYPTHEMIESGTAPSSLFLTDQLKKCVSWDVLFPELYKYQRD